jgi:hypothetical protein
LTLSSKTSKQEISINKKIMAGYPQDKMDYRKGLDTTTANNRIGAIRAEGRNFSSKSLLCFSFRLDKY